MTRKLAVSAGVISVLVVVPSVALAQAPPPVPAPSPATGAPPATVPEMPPPPPSPPPPVTAPPPALTYAPSNPAATPAVSSSTGVEFTSLRLMRDKGIITQAEYESAVHDLAETTGEHAPKEGTAVLGKWATTLYGFVESDSIWDSTRSLNDLAGGSAIAPHGTPAGDNSRVTFGVRNSRIGFRLKAPETNGVRASAMLEMDFFGTQLPTGPGTSTAGQVQPYQGSEGAYLTNPTFRVRHFNFKVETPVVDFLVGQYWQLFGWQSAYDPNTVQIQGVPGQIYGRTPQIRISKTVKTYPVTFEAAVAATRPVQRDSGVPDGQAGLRLAIDAWTGVQTVGPTGTQISPLSVAVTGLLRRVRVDNFSAAPTYTNDLTMSALAVDGFLPVLPGTKEDKNNSLSLNGEFATGYGSADQYTGFTGGIGYPALPNPTKANPAPAYTPNIDNGIVTYDNGGHLHGIQWQSYLIGAQYYFPGVNGKFWVSGNYSHMESANMHFYGAPTKAYFGEDFFDVNLFVDPTSAVRLGVEYANFDDQYVSGLHTHNNRVQLSGFFIF